MGRQDSIRVEGHVPRGLEGSYFKLKGDKKRHRHKVRKGSKKIVLLSSSEYSSSSGHAPRIIVADSDLSDGDLVKLKKSKHKSRCKDKKKRTIILKSKGKGKKKKTSKKKSKKKSKKSKKKSKKKADRGSIILVQRPLSSSTTSSTSSTSSSEPQRIIITVGQGRRGAPRARVATAPTRRRGSSRGRRAATAQVQDDGSILIAMRDQASSESAGHGGRTRRGSGGHERQRRDGEVVRRRKRRARRSLSPRGKRRSRSPSPVDSGADSPTWHVIDLTASGDSSAVPVTWEQLSVRSQSSSGASSLDSSVLSPTTRIHTVTRVLQHDAEYLAGHHFDAFAPIAFVFDEDRYFVTVKTGHRQYAVVEILRDGEAFKVLAIRKTPSPRVHPARDFGKLPLM